MRNSIFILLLLSVGATAQVDSLPYFADHSDDVSCVVFSPDGKYVLTGSWDNTVIIHRNDSIAETLQVLDGFRGAVKTMAFSRDGYRLIIGGQDGRLNFYDFDDSNYEIATKDTAFFLENTQINKLIYGPGMRTVFSAGDDGHFITFDLVKEKMMPIKGTKSITAAAVAIDRMSYFIAVQGSPVINQFDIFGKLINTFVGHGNDLTDLLVTVDRKYLISSSKDKTIRVWEIANAREESLFMEHTWAVTDIDMDPFGQYLVSSSLDGTVNLYDLKEKALKEQYKLTEHKVNAVALSPDNTKIVAAAQPEGVSDSAGFFFIETEIPARKVVMPKKMDLEAVRKINQERAKKIKEEKNAEAKEGTDSALNKRTSTTKPNANTKVLKQTKQVTITITDDE